MARRGWILSLLILTIGHSATLAEAEPVIGLGNSTPPAVVYDVPWDGALSSDGRAFIVSQFDSEGTVETVLWRDLQGPIPLADQSSGLTLGRAFGLSGDGHTAVGFVETEFGVFWNEGAIWRDTGEITRMGFLRPAEPYRSSQANAVSSDGSVVVGHSDLVATIWTEATGLQAIPLADDSGIPGSFRGLSQANGVSGDGRVIVGLYGSSVFIWDAVGGTTMVHNRACGVSYLGGAITISEDGTSVIGTSRIDGLCQAYIWTRSTGIQVLGFGDSEYPFTASPLALTPDGSVVVGEYECPNLGYVQCAFVWTREMGFTDLRALLEISGVDTSEWVSLQRVWGISADGKKIVGIGSRSPNQNETFIATLGEASTGVGLCEVGTPDCVPVEIVARSNQMFPGSRRSYWNRYYSFSLPQINGNGQIAFNASVFGNGGWGIFGPDTDGQTSLRVEARDVAPGVGDGTALFHSLYAVGPTSGSDDPAMNHAGDIAFAARVSLYGLPGVWTSRRGDTSPSFIYQLGTGLPPIPSDFDMGIRPFVQIDREGDASIRLVGVAGSTIARSEGLGNFAALLGTGDPAPGIEGDVEFVTAYTHWINNFGNTALWGYLRGPGVDESNDTAIWGTDMSGALSLIVREGDPVPGFAAGTTFVRQIRGYAEHLSYNDRGQVAFLAEMSGAVATDPTTSGLWKWSPFGSLELLVHSTDLIPGGPPGRTFGGFGEPILNVIGDVAFRHGYPSSRYWKISASGDLVSLLGSGDQAPHLAPGVTLGIPFHGGLRQGGGDLSTGDPLLSDNGSLFLDFFLEGEGVDATNGRVLYHVSPQGDQATLVVRTGDEIEVALNDVRTISDYTIGSGFRSGLGRRPTNARSDIVARVDFDDGSQAIVNFVVPEPGFGLGLGLGCILSIGFWRSRSALR